jgi:predicted metal-dependent phosphoesterase TrpH
MRSKKLIPSLAVVALSWTALSCTPHYKWQQLRNDIASIRDSRSISSLPGGYRDFPGAIHVHTELSGDSHGTLEAIAEATRMTDGVFVITTDHHRPKVYEKGFEGWKDGVLFVRGSEIIKGCKGITGAGCNSLLVLGVDRYIDPKEISMREVIEQIHASGGLAIAAHPDGFVDWDTPIDGMEIYDILDDAAEKEWKYPKWVFDVLYSYRPYRDEVFSSILDPPVRGVRKYDGLTATRRVVAVAGNDAHQNVRWAGRQIDPYSLSLRFVRTHVLSPTLTNKTDLLRAIASGHAYISFDGVVDGSGFGFWAEDAEPDGSSYAVKIMGDEVPLRTGLRLRIQIPAEGKIRVVRNGTKAEETISRGLTVPVKETGVDRVEVLLKIRGRWWPWIYSNPIYVRSGGDL